MNKLTKIVATIGPASDTEEMIETLIRSGVNIFRFNFKHGTVEWHGERIQRVRKVADAIGMPVGTLIDLQGPEIRTNMPTDEISFEKGEQLLFGEEVFRTDTKGFSISHPEIIEEFENGQKLLADDGRRSFTLKRENGKTFLVSDSTGSMKNRRNVSIPGSSFTFPVLIERDFEGLKLAALHNIDYIALSYVRSAKDIEVLREEIKKHKITSRVMSKIEAKKAIENLDELIEASDAIMVARGDLGVELPAEEVPYYQKMIITKCLERGIPVITATQMLQSMVESPIPTRAEVSDVANAVYDFTDAVMLSGETANGQYPVEAVEVMARTAKYIEMHHPVAADARSRFNYSLNDQTEMICDAAYNLYLRYRKKEQHIKGFIIFTQSGRTARIISRYRPKAPIYAFTPNKDVLDSLALSYGVMPLLHTDLQLRNEVTKVEIIKAVEYLHKKDLVKKDENYILLHGDLWMVQGGTSTVRIITV